MQPLCVVWLRRDLRLDDHAALSAARAAGERIVCAFVLDPPLLRGPRVGAPIVQFFFDALAALRDELRALGSELVLLEADAPGPALVALARRLGARIVRYAEDDDPDARARDAQAERVLRDAGLAAEAVRDHTSYAPNEVAQDDGRPYVVFGAYKRRWLARRFVDSRPPYPSRRGLRAVLLDRAAIGETRALPAPEAYGHIGAAAYPRSGSAEAARLLRVFVAGPAADYARLRNVPALEGTSRLSPHLRAGTIGIRTVVAAAEASDAWLTELIWREFSHHVLARFPHAAHASFRPEGEVIDWRDDAAGFAAWCEGRTGYPIVDAAMLQLRTTGWMHNRLRMIVASFLTKDLLIDWRRGERWFEQRLADADRASNNGGWQWCASTGTDPSPAFRVFNPVLQGRTYDPDGAFVRRWIPALGRVPAAAIHAPWTLAPLVQAEAGVVIGRDYPFPIVDHAFARDRALAAYRTARLVSRS